ncbi:MAG: GNAT family N-acetyltransferase [Ignavibacteriaceae bacterium]
MYKIRPLLKSEINLLKNFPPESWNLDLPVFISFHFDYPYFYPVVAEENNKIIGFGNGILNGSTGWLGNILVPSEFRRRGIGNEITGHLVEYFHNKGCTSQLLIASEMGKNIYARLGFKESSSYQFLRKGSYLPDYSKNENIRRINDNDFDLLKKFDEEISGEKRIGLIRRFFATGWIYQQKNANDIQGVLLPDLGGGLIFAKNPEAGLELIKLKLDLGKFRSVIPTDNETALNFLKSLGFEIYSTAPRMVLGVDVNWQPKYVYNRAAGYCG